MTSSSFRCSRAVQGRVVFPPSRERPARAGFHATTPRRSADTAHASGGGASRCHARTAPVGVTCQCAAHRSGRGVVSTVALLRAAVRCPACRASLPLPWWRWPCSPGAPRPMTRRRPRAPPRPRRRPLLRVPSERPPCRWATESTRRRPPRDRCSAASDSAAVEAPSATVRGSTSRPVHGTRPPSSPCGAPSTATEVSRAGRPEAARRSRATGCPPCPPARSRSPPTTRPIGTTATPIPSGYTLDVDLPAPETAPAPSCVGGTIGVSVLGVAIYSAFDAMGRDAAGHEVQDDCDGHPERTGQYHYHSLSSCWSDVAGFDPGLFGYALDGFGIYVQRTAGGALPSSARDARKPDRHRLHLCWHVDGSGRRRAGIATEARSAGGAPTA